MVQWVIENGFRVYNVHGGFYGASSKYLEDQRDAWLAKNKHMVGTKKSRVYQAILANIRITPGGGGHWNIISAEDHLETAIGMLPGGAPAKDAKAGGGGTGTVARQPAPPQQQPPQQAPPPPRTPAQLVNDAVEPGARRRAGGGGAPRRHGRRRRHRRHPHPADHQPPSEHRRAAPAAQPHPPALPLYDVLYGTAVVADLGVIDARSLNSKAADARRRQLFLAVLDGLVTDVQPRTAIEAPGTPLTRRCRSPASGRWSRASCPSSSGPGSTCASASSRSSAGWWTGRASPSRAPTPTSAPSSRPRSGTSPRPPRCTR